MDFIIWIKPNKRKFREESDFVCVRVPMGKRKEYRLAINEFVEEKFAKVSFPIDKPSKVKIFKKESMGFRRFEEFFKELKKLDDNE
ncbi:MAG: hypothetical protein ACFFC3_00155 [Candidatus Odinarchaeota archaeon]